MALSTGSVELYGVDAGVGSSDSNAFRDGSESLSPHWRDATVRMHSSRRRSLQAAETFAAQGIEQMPLDPDRVHKRGPVTYYDGQVLLYDSEAVTSLLSMPAVWKATTFVSATGISRLMKDLCFLWSLSAAVLCIMKLCDFEGHKDVESRGRWLEPGRSIVLETRSIVTFLMGFFLSSALGRWWAIRNNCLGGLWGACDDLVMLMSAHFPTNSQQHCQIRKLVLRWCTVSFQLVFKQARQSDNDIEDLVQAGLLTREEKTALDQFPSKAQVIWAWMTSFCSHLAYGDEDQGGGCLPFPREILPQLHQICTKARGSIGETFAYTDSQIPLRYFAMLAHTTWMMNLFQSIYSGYVLNHAMNLGWKATFWCELVFLIFYTSLFTSLLVVGESMLNPVRACFSEGFPGAAFGEFLRNESAAFQQANVDPPYGKPTDWLRSKACQKYWFGAK